MTYPSNDQEREHVAEQARLRNVLINSIYILSRHPYAVFVCVAVICILNQITISVCDTIAGPLPPDSSWHDAARFAGVLMCVLVLRVPFDALIDSCVLGAVHAMRRGTRLSTRLLADYTRTFIARMFIVNIVALGITVAALIVCSPILFLVTWYLRFAAVYILAEDVGPREAFSRTASIILDPRSRFMLLYVPATALLIVIVFLARETGADPMHMARSMLGDLILGYADLVLTCTAFYLFAHMKKVQVQSDGQ